MKPHETTIKPFMKPLIDAVASVHGYCQNTTTKPQRNHDETATKPLEFYRQNDETTGFYKIIISICYTLFLQNGGFVVSSTKHEWFRHGFVTVSSWFRHGSDRGSQDHSRLLKIALVRAWTIVPFHTCTYYMRVLFVDQPIDVLPLQYMNVLRYHCRANSTCMYHDQNTCMCYDHGICMYQLMHTL